MQALTGNAQQMLRVTGGGEISKIWKHWKMTPMNEDLR